MRQIILILFGIFCCLSAFAEEIKIENYVIKNGETFHKIARSFNLGVDEILRANPQITDVNKIYSGTKIIVPTTHLLPNAKEIGIVINLAEPRLYFFSEEEIETFPISVGSDAKTPTGLTKIIAKKENPTWIPPQSIREEKPDLPEIIEPGPQNPLGNHAIYLDGSRNKKWQRIVIHSTNTPWTIGSKISHGCIRMYPQDISKLFEIAAIGTRVLVINQPVKVQQIDDKIYLESHLNEAPILPVKDGDYGKLICKRIKDCKDIDWDKVDQALSENLGIPVEVTDEGWW